MYIYVVIVVIIIILFIITINKTIGKIHKYSQKYESYTSVKYDNDDDEKGKYNVFQQ